MAVTPCDPYEKEGISRPLSPSVSDVVTQLETRGAEKLSHTNNSQEGVSFSNGIRHKQEDIRATLQRGNQSIMGKCKRDSCPVHVERVFNA